MTSTSNEAFMESWRLSLHDKSPNTVRAYTDELRRFAAWLADNDRPKDHTGDLLAVGRNDVEVWIGSMKDRGLSGSTVRARWIALRSFYGWLLVEEEIDRSPLERVTVPKPSPPPVPTLSGNDITLLLKACSGTDFAARRDNALIRLLLSTGLRLSEALNLTLEDVDLRSRVIHVRHGKGDRARLVRIDAATGAAVDRYLRARSKHKRGPGSPWVWVTDRSDHLSTTGVQLILKRRATQAGIGHVHAHKFRHTFADRWLAAGGTEGDLQRLGGWESAEIMRRYGSHRATDRALAAYDMVNPMEGL